MNKVKSLIAFLIMLGLLTACNGQNSKEESLVGSTESYKAKESKSEIAYDMATEEAETEETVEVEKTANDEVQVAERMIIHHANLTIKVDSIDNFQQATSKKVIAAGGYIVESNVYRESEQHVNGYMIVRVPEKEYNTFLANTEDEAVEVMERSVSGQDVTEDYVDLESKLKSKKIVEERLLTFLGDAKKTEDLLEISNDLAKVQEEIETLVGKMKYLENQSSFATIHINMHEERVVIPNIEGKKLNTWEKTKQQLATSTNFLLSSLSAIVVFFVGNLPVFILLSLLAFVIYTLIKRKKQKK